MKLQTMNESFSGSIWKVWFHLGRQLQGCCFSNVGEEPHTSKSMEKGSEISWRCCRLNIPQMPLFSHVFSLHLWSKFDFISCLKRLHVCGSSRVL